MKIKFIIYAIVIFAIIIIWILYGYFISIALICLFIATLSGIRANNLGFGSDFQDLYIIIAIVFAIVGVVMIMTFVDVCEKEKTNKKPRIEKIIKNK